MRRQTLLVFDDYVASGLNVRTSSAFHEILGRSDQLSIHAIVDNIVANGTNTVKFDAWIEHCADGINWVQRSTNLTTAGNGDIAMTWAPASISDRHKMWSDAAVNTFSSNVGPLLPYVRVRLLFTAGAGHIAVHATLRDPG